MQRQAGPNGGTGTPSSFGTPLTSYGGGAGGGDPAPLLPETYGGSGGGSKFSKNTDQYGLIPLLQHL